jgi:hypothetical protein
MQKGARRLVTAEELGDMYDNMDPMLRDNLNRIYYERKNTTGLLGYYRPSEPGRIYINGTRVHDMRTPRANWMDDDISIKDSIAETMYHEAGHNFIANVSDRGGMYPGSYPILDKGKYKDGSGWTRARLQDAGQGHPYKTTDIMLPQKQTNTMEKGKESWVSSYAFDKNSETEDFAESVAGWSIDRERFAQDYPARNRILELYRQRYSGYTNNTKLPGRDLNLDG